MMTFRKFAIFLLPHTSWFYGITVTPDFSSLLGHFSAHGTLHTLFIPFPTGLRGFMDGWMDGRLHGALFGCGMEKSRF